jgi:hypothetical protein
MGDFKGAFIEGLGKSLAYGLGGLIFLLVLGLLIGAGVYTFKDKISGSIRDAGIADYIRSRWNSDS